MRVRARGGAKVFGAHFDTGQGNLAHEFFAAVVADNAHNGRWRRACMADWRSLGEVLLLLPFLLLLLIVFRIIIPPPTSPSLERISERRGTEGEEEDGEQNQ